MKIVLSHIRPPIPVRDFDWQATLDGYEPGDPIGHGRTPEDAKADLIEQLDDEKDTAALDEYRAQTKQEEIA